MASERETIADLSGAETVTDVIRARYAVDDRRSFCRLVFPGEPDQQLTYREFIDRARRWSAFYRGPLGLHAGATVVIILPHSIDLYAANLGAVLAGMVPAMLAFPSEKQSTLEYGRTIGRLLESTSASLVVTYAALRAALPAFVGDSAPKITDVPSTLPEIDAADWPEGVIGSDVAFLQFSSGTTGLKKGIAISHRALLWQIRKYATAIALTDSDVIVSWLPLYHDMGLICCFWLPILTATPLVAMSPFDWVKRPVMVLEAISRFRGTLTWWPNFAYSFLAQNVSEDQLRGLDLSALRGVVNCSEPITAVSQDRFARRFSSNGFQAQAFAASYAMAEITFAVTSGGFDLPLVSETIHGDVLATQRRAVPAEGTDARTRTLVSSGKALPETEIRIVDAAGRPVEDRVVGEIVVTSPSLLKEYHRNPSATAAALHDGQLHTGDMGYLAEGQLFVTGRKKDLLILAGKNVFPQDIEDIVAQVRGVIPGRVAAIGVADAELGTERLVVIAETNEPDRAAIAAAIAVAVAAGSDVVTSDVYVVEHKWLRKSSSGKISRELNRERYLAERGAQKTAPEPAIVAEGSVVDSTETEKRVMQCVVRVAQRKNRVLPPEFGSETSLMRGGLIDSLSVVALAVELEREFGRSFPESALQVQHFDTVRAIVRLVNSVESPGVPLTGSALYRSAPPVAADEGGSSAGPVFDAYVSLGQNCEAGLQFQRIGYDEPTFFRFTNSPFELTYALLENDFAGVFRKENLRALEDSMVRDVGSGVIFHAGFKTVPGSSPGECQFVFGPEFDEAYRLYYRLTILGLAQKWRDLTASDRRVLYVLKVIDGSGPEYGERLAKLLATRFPRHRFTILVVQTEDRREPQWKLPNVVNRYLLRFAPSHDSGNADVSGWDRIFDEFPLESLLERRAKLRQAQEEQKQRAAAVAAQRERLTALWRGKLDAGVAFARTRQSAAAMRSMHEAIQSVQACGDPRVILDALLGVSEALQSLDQGRASFLLGLAVSLAYKMEWRDEAARARAILHRGSSAKIAAHR